MRTIRKMVTTSKNEVNSVKLNVEKEEKGRRVLKEDCRQDTEGIIGMNLM
jgi:hypothetical protein